MPTYPNEIWPADAAVEALDGTTDPLTGLPYIAKGTGPTSVPTLEVQYNRREQRCNAILAGWRQGMVTDEGGFKIGVYPIQYTLGGQRKTFDGATGVTLAQDAAKVVYLNAAGALIVADVWPSDLTSFLPLATVDTHDGHTAISDARAYAAFNVPSLQALGASDRRIVTAYCASIGANQNDVQIFAYDPPEDLTLVEVQVFCTATNATASVNVKEGGVTVLAAPATPSAGNIVKPTVADAAIAGTNNVTIHATTNGSGAITNLTVTLLFKAPLAV
jgi:hypothetical protein